VRESAEVKPDHNEEALRGAFKEKLSHYALIFRELSSSFTETAVFAEKEENDRTFRQLLGDISKKVCDGCSMLELCWQKITTAHIRICWRYCPG
jgi:stage II sporulation protein E